MAEKHSYSPNRRIRILIIIILFIGFGLAGGKTIWLMVFRGAELSQKAAEQQLLVENLSAQRGVIYDCNMNPLAQSAAVYTVYIDPSSITETVDDNAKKEDKEAAKLKESETEQKIANGLAAILDMDATEILAKCKNRDSRYEKIKTKVEQNVADQVNEFISTNSLGNIIGTEQTNKRYYPGGSLASTVLGFVGDDDSGLYGVEYQYDSELSGTPGKRVALRTPGGSPMPYEYDTMVEPQAGNSVVLTIDKYVQYYAEQRLEEAIVSNGATNRGCCIVMNVNNGEILAMTTKGDYDPNDPFEIADEKTKQEIEKLPESEKAAAETSALAEQWRNKALNDTYEPGSVFKIVTGSAGLEEGKVTKDSTFYCPGYINIYDTRYNCHELSGHGSQTLKQAFENSCNPAFIEIGQRLGVSLFYKYFRAFGFTEPTGIDLPGESTAVYYSENEMGPVELASESFGQTFKVTPIQMITAVAAAANGGYLVQPHVAKKIIDSDGNTVKTFSTETKRQVISNQTSKQMCEFLESVVANGSGKSAYVAGYRMCGKTGTSEKIEEYAEDGEMTYVASFSGFAPADDPEIAIIVIIDEPRNGLVYGSQVSAPVAASIMSDILEYVGVSASYTDSEKSLMNVKTPSVVGNSTEQALETLEAAGFTAYVQGDGDTVFSQTPLGNQVAPAGGVVYIYTEENAEHKKVTVPTLTDLNASSVQYYANISGLNVELSGVAGDSSSAISYKQSVEAGKEIDAGTVITVYFRYSDSVE